MIERAIAELLYTIEKEQHNTFEQYLQNFEAVETAMTQLKNRLELHCGQEIKTEAENRLKLAAQKSSLVYYQIHIYSFLAVLCDSVQYIECIQKLLLEDATIPKETAYFLTYQILTKQDTSVNLGNYRTELNQRRIYTDILGKFRAQIGELRWIPVQQRNQNLIVVMTSQMLGLGHAPTKTALDRAAIIRHTMGKQVLIINTAEILSMLGRVPFYELRVPVYHERYLECDAIEYMGEQYSYVQCGNNMPNAEDISAICSMISQLKPYCIVGIGGVSIATDLCSQIVPTVMVSTGFSRLTVTEGQFQVIGRKLGERDRQLLQETGKTESHVIESRFTFSLVPQEGKLTRKQLQLPEDSFVCIVVGARLDAELYEDFMQLLNQLMQSGIYIVFAGNFGRYSEWCERFPVLKQHSSNLGFRTDMPAILDCCDLYLNPNRVGGGTSVIEAMAKGVPAVTLNYGDVALSAGADFCTESYQTMYDTIVRYASDSEYYCRMSEAARERAAYMLDGSGAFMEVMKEAEGREAFR